MKQCQGGEVVLLSMLPRGVIVEAREMGSKLAQPAIKFADLSM